MYAVLFWCKSMGRGKRDLKSAVVCARTTVVCTKRGN